MKAAGSLDDRECVGHQPRALTLEYIEGTNNTHIERDILTGRQA